MDEYLFAHLVLLGHHKGEHLHIIFVLCIINDITAEHRHARMESRNKLNFTIKRVFVENSKVGEHAGFDAPERVLHADYASGDNREFIYNIFRRSACEYMLLSDRRFVPHVAITSLDEERIEASSAVSV